MISTSPLDFAHLTGAPGHRCQLVPQVFLGQQLVNFILFYHVSKEIPMKIKVLKKIPFFILFLQTGNSLILKLITYDKSPHADGVIAITY